MTLEQRLQAKLNGHFYGVKTVEIQVDDIDEPNRIVKGYIASFGTLDSDNDVIRKGAFKKSIQERGPLSEGNRKIAHLRNHDWEQQIGLFTELVENNSGLRFVSKMGRSSKGTDALLDYQDGILREHSIGFNYIGDKMKFVEADKSSFDETNGHWEISEVKLWEGSGVTFGANEFTPTTEANKGNAVDYLKNLNEEMDTLTNALKSGGTDTRLENIELRLKVIQQKFNSLITVKPPVKALPENEPNPKPSTGEAQKQFYINLLK